MADDIKSKRVKPNPSTGTISGDISKFVLNPLKSLFKDERKNQVEEEAIVQGEEQNVYEPEEVKLDQKDLNKKSVDFTAREKEVIEILTKFNQQNLHKMIPIPVCEIPKELK